MMWVNVSASYGISLSSIARQKRGSNVVTVHNNLVSRTFTLRAKRVSHPMRRAAAAMNSPTAPRGGHVMREHARHTFGHWWIMRGVNITYFNRHRQQVTDWHQNCRHALWPIFTKLCFSMMPSVVHSSMQTRWRQWRDSFSAYFKFVRNVQF